MNKKSIFSVAIMLLVFKLVNAQQIPFNIRGQIEGKSDAYIFLSYTGDDDKPKIDSAFIQNGKFTFSGALAWPKEAILRMDRLDASKLAKQLPVIIEPGNMNVSIRYDAFEQGQMTGSKAQEVEDILTRAKAAIMIPLTPLQQAYEKAARAYRNARNAKKDQATLRALMDKLSVIQKKLAPYEEQALGIEKEFVDKHPGSFAAARMLVVSVGRNPLHEGLAKYEQLSEGAKNSLYGKMVKAKLEKMKMGSAGAVASNFTATELKGGKLNLSDYRGKHVLIDFWASWCVPCREGNPHLISLYGKYKAKGFEIIGIADDARDLAAWEKAVEQDKIGIWKHILSGAAGLGNYGIATLPTKILINPEGMIIGRYGGGGEDDTAMNKKLAEIFGS